VETGGFGEDALMFTDRTHEWNTASGEPTIASLGLEGVDYIRFANDDKSNSTFGAEIDLAPGLKDIYLLIDVRNDESDIYDILNGNPFADTGVDIGADESGDGDIDNESSLFVLADFTGTSITLGPNNHDGNMYGFLAAPVASGVIPEPSTLAVWSLLVALAVTFGCRKRRRR
jgi:hypothetical protein